jgi:hypothetical protein
LRCGLQPQLELNQQIEEVWAEFCGQLSELESNIAICDAFSRAADEVCEDEQEV